MAVHNQRLNRQLMSACATLSHDQVAGETGGFFGSMVRHWNHIMFADLTFLRRLSAAGLPSEALDGLVTFPAAHEPTDVYFADMAMFERRRNDLDKIIRRYVEGFDESLLAWNIRFTNTEGGKVSISIGDLLLHMFLHQVHHRGQITTLVSQFGIDYGCTDLPIVVPEGSVAYAAESAEQNKNI